MEDKKLIGDEMNDYFNYEMPIGASMLGMGELTLGIMPSSGYSGKPTEIQKRIELNVTNGLGYEQKSEHLSFLDVLSDSFLNSYNRNTNEGLQIHLAEMDNRVKPDFELENIITTYKKLATQMTNRERNLSISNRNLKKDIDEENKSITIRGPPQYSSYKFRENF